VWKLLIETTLGVIDDSQLSMETIVENVPCGQCVTTIYKLNGAIVRQDIRINVKQGFGAETDGGI
jgi:hypothetical protein